MFGSLIFTRREGGFSRGTYIALAVGTIGLGLLVHLRAAMLGLAVRDVLRDALWATMIAWLAGAIAPRAALARRSVAALAFCFVVEISQSWHTPGLDAVRRTTMGHLVLGSGFDVRDFVAYAGGVVVAAFLEPRLWRLQK